MNAQIALGMGAAVEGLTKDGNAVLVAGALVTIVLVLALRVIRPKKN